MFVKIWKIFLFSKITPDVELGVITGAELSNDEELAVFINQMVAAKTPLEIPSFLVSHDLLVPVWKNVFCELGCYLGHTDAKVGVVDVKIVRDAPNNDQVEPLPFQLPCEASRASSESLLLIVHCYHYFFVAWEYFSFVIFCKIHDW